NREENEPATKQSRKGAEPDSPSPTAASTQRTFLWQSPEQSQSPGFSRNRVFLASAHGAMGRSAHLLHVMSYAGLARTTNARRSHRLRPRSWVSQRIDQCTLPAMLRASQSGW